MMAEMTQLRVQLNGTGIPVRSPPDITSKSQQRTAKLSPLQSKSNPSLSPLSDRKPVNGQLLPSPMNGDASTTASTPLPSSSSAERLIKELERNLDLERRLRLDVETSSNSRIADLETELTLTKAELSVAELLQTYIPPKDETIAGNTKEGKQRLESGAEELQRYLRKLEAGEGIFSP
jgi:hypothetical protein